LAVAAVIIFAAEIALIWSALRGPARPRAFHEAGLYATIIDTVYGRHATQVFLQQHPESASEYLADPSIQQALRAALGQGAASETIAAYQARNARPAGFDWSVQDRATLLDSLTAEKALTSDSAARAILKGAPGILVLSQPGFAVKDPVALMYAAMRSPRSRSPDHVASAAFLVLRWNDVRWTVAHEIPIPLR
jgi:hypothetical protein